MPALENQWALILGASSGFGAAAARELAKAGMNIFGVHFDKKETLPAAKQVMADIENYGRKQVFWNTNAAGDDRRPKVIAEIKATLAAHGGPQQLHVLMHSLAFGTLKPIFVNEKDARLSRANIEMTIDVMASSLIYWVQDLLDADLLQEGGRIFAMTSAGSSKVWKSYAAVSAAKASLESYIRQLAVELAPRKITANAILAGTTDTPALRKIPEHKQMISDALRQNPYDRLTTPEDVGQCLVALSLPETYWLNGNTLLVDGGEFIVN